MRISLIVFSLLESLILTACTAVVERIPGVYSLDIQQGNIISQDMIDQLRPNMNKRQVLFIMGSPMLTDVFHQKRWDYLYSEQPGGEARMQKRISLFFDEDQLIGVQGDFKPNNVPTLGVSKDVTVDVPKRKVEKTLFQKIGGIFSSDDEEQESEASGETENKKVGPDAEKNSGEIEEGLTDGTATEPNQETDAVEPHDTTDPAAVDVNKLEDAEIKMEKMEQEQAE